MVWHGRSLLARWQQDFSSQASTIQHKGRPQPGIDYLY
jgi:hypothetical protein